MEQPLIPGLAEEVVRAAERVHRRRRRRLQVATAAASVVVLVAAFAVVSTVQAPPAEAGVDIAVRDGRVEVRLTDVETRPGVVEDVLRDAGIDADVSARPVGPSNLGRFVSVSVIDDDDSLVEDLDYNGSTWAGFAVDVDYDGGLDIAIGRPARAGESYDSPSDAFAPGEPLACEDLVGRTARDLPEIAADHPEIDLRVRVGGVGTEAAPADLAGGPYADWLVAEALAYSPSDVRITVTVDGEPELFDPDGAEPPDDDCD